MVSTPIGNLGDLSARAIDVLTEADYICCEDTRRTWGLLSAAGITGGPGRLVSLHQHNEMARVAQVATWVREGRVVAVVSDAGTPGVSDPGARLVSAVIQQGSTVTVVPGPSAVMAALVVSGLPTDRFCVEGFLPRKGAERRRRLDVLAREQRTAVILEAPGRLAATLADLAAACGDRPVAVARELTKLHEEVWRGTLEAAAAEWGARPVRGEVVIVLGGAPPEPAPGADSVRAALQVRLSLGDGVRQAAAAVAEELGVPRRQAYAMALELHVPAPRAPSGD
jgi:16S rRNA (cytidine1402-2'-O)-methyltransferase